MGRSGYSTVGRRIWQWGNTVEPWRGSRWTVDVGVCVGGHFPIAAAGASQQCLFLVSDAPGSVVTVHIPNSCLLQQDF